MKKLGLILSIVVVAAIAVYAFLPSTPPPPSPIYR
jgi:uncharacterized membrane protein